MPTFTTRPELSGTFGMVASTHWLASAAGMAMLESGGNAFDAAAAAGFALQVCEPHLNGPGGDAPLLVWPADAGAPSVICGQGPMPAAATVDSYRALGLELVPGTGPLAAAVPGAVDAWLLMLRDHGTRSLRDVMRYAIGYARDGVPVVPPLAATLAGVAEFFTEHWPSSAQLWLDDAGRAPAAGTRIANPVLATTYERLVADGEAAGSDREAQIERAREAWLRGWVAQGMLEGARTPAMDSSGSAHPGMLDAADLASFSATVEPCVTLDFAGATVFKTGAWGQGPVLLQQLALLAGFDIAAMGFGSADHLHTVAECAKLAFADREAWYGDAAPVPLEALLSAAYADERRALVGAEASLDLRPGSPDGRDPRITSLLAVADATAAAEGSGEPTLTEPAEDAPLDDVTPAGGRRGDTCHLDVADRWGNMVSATPSGGWLQSSPALAGLGFCLGTRGQMTWLEDGLPSSLAGARRPRSTLSPSFARRDDGTRIAFGTPGGDQQDQWQLGFLLNHLVFGMDLQAAIDAPALHSEHFPSSFWPRNASPGRLVAEGRIAPEVVAELERRGHRVAVRGDWTLGRLSAVSRSEDGVLRGAANPRGMQGYAIGR